MYVLAPNQIVEIYPYSFGDLQRDNPNTSFPANPSDAVLSEWNVFPVTDNPTPDYNPATHNLTEGDPILIDDMWEKVWAVTPATPEQIAERTSAKESEVRQQRNALLSDSDWTQLPDAPGIPAMWAPYRQQLRDVTSQPGFPWDVIWPVIPSESTPVQFMEQIPRGNSIASGSGANANASGQI